MKNRFLMDLTTSRQYKGHNAVGIVRTEREIAKALIGCGEDLCFFYFDLNRKCFIYIPLSEAKSILGVDVQSDIFHIKHEDTKNIPTSKDEKSLHNFLAQIEQKRTSVADINMNITTDEDHEEKIEFFIEDIVVSAGLLWDGDFTELLYIQKKSVGFKFVQVIYDIVPVIIPEFCVPGMNIRFPKYILNTAWTADILYCISDCTLRDVKQFLVENDLPVPALRRIELGVDIALPSKKISALRQTLDSGKFIVYVSTIEPRKNHVTLFHAWRQLYKNNRDKLIPLVIVGRHGWNSSDLITMMQAADSLYPEYLKILTEVSDEDLDWLYRNSRFTVYPSLYEGWGLPVAESLARGKLCLAANNSSIPEVGAGLAPLIAEMDISEWVKQIDYYLSNPEAVLAHEEKIRRSYKIVSWKYAMEEFISSILKNPVEAVSTSENINTNT